MQGLQIIDYAAVFALSLAALVAALWWVTRPAGKPKGKQYEPPPGLNATRFLFEDGMLVDATKPGKRLLEHGTGACEWARLQSLLGARFPDFPQTQLAALDMAPATLFADQPDDDAQVELERYGDAFLVWLRDHDDAEAGSAADAHRIRALEAELQVLRRATEGMPCPVWHSDAAGKVRWSNKAYAGLAARVRGDDADPTEPLFPARLDGQPSHTHVRCSLDGDDADNAHWYDLSMVRFGDDRMYYALDANAVVDAEIAQRNFVQTLAKTFAHLSTGLAIFDRHRQLVLFNPALIDLTALPADFLSRRPDLHSFFDRLRDSRMMLEPKNYASWRDQIADVVAAAADGRYQETWTLPSGSTYQVTGRPHPDGALAFLFEDISAEVSLTRRFRSELELGQSLIDSLDRALAVFTGNGVLSISNAACREMWAMDPEAGFAEMTVLDATRLWQAQCEATPVWGEIRNFVAATEERTEWDGLLRKKDGTRLHCRVCPILSGATLISFETLTPQARHDAPETATAGAGA